MNTCDKCKHYTAPDLSAKDEPYQGRCRMTLDDTDFLWMTPVPLDRAMGWGEHRASLFVGPKFGCIHWEGKA